MIWQVEHPVTEGITGCNVPAMQLMVAMGCDITKLTPDTGITPYIVDFSPDAPKVRLAAIAQWAVVLRLASALPPPPSLEE